MRKQGIGTPLRIAKLGQEYDPVARNNCISVRQAHECLSRFQPSAKSQQQYASVLRSITAPILIISISNVMNNPCIDAAAIARPGIFQASAAMAAIST